MVNLYLQPKITDDAKRKHIYDGSIIVFSPSPSTIALCEYAKKMIQNAFNGSDPQKAQFTMEVEDFVSIAGPLKSKFTNDDQTKILLKNLLDESGYDLNKTYFDVPRLRIVTHGGYLSSGVGYAYKAHRDTWYSSSRSQVNWWMSIYPLEPSQSLTFYPTFWNRPIDNSSAGFDYKEWANVGRKQAMSQIKADTRKHPLPLQELDDDDELRVVSSAAQPILFSGAHLHATSSNNSNLTRFSIDFRTVHIDDLISKRGAHNIDSSAKGTIMGDFFLASDFSPIPKELIC